uniref:GDT1 family protein n=1 Tax=Echinococcus granulosus TaxID=6210 RepID=A0A068WF88_ECHGR|nr:transmembrane protein 165 [Echinococcus granulosus]
MNSRVRGVVILVLLTALFAIDCAVIPQGNQVEAAFLENNRTQIAPTYYKRFLHGFLASVYVIIISELGDKTFFIAAILSINHPRLLVYGGAMFALITMTVLSALLGFATEVLPRVYTYYASGFLFVLFGIKMLKDAYNMKPEDTKEEYKEVQQQLSTNEIREITSCIHIRNVLLSILSPVFVEAFMMTFLAEWGDRSQITTIVLAAREDVIGVIAGGVLGHGLCTGLAVLAGRVVAQRIPVKWLTYIGGVTFLLFGIATFATHPYSR